MFDLERFRNERNLSQRELAGKLGVQQPYISRIEGGRDPMPDVLVSKLNSLYPSDDFSKYRNGEPVSTTENQRFEHMLNFAIASKKVRNQQQFTEEIQSDKATVSQIKNGRIKIPNNLFANIGKAFPDISIDWLKTGEGKMLNNNQQIGDISNSTVVGSNISGTGINISHNDFSEMIELQKGYQELLRKKDEHVSDLLSIISKLTCYGK